MKLRKRVRVAVCALLACLCLNACSGMESGGDAGEVLEAVFSAVEGVSGRGISYFDRTRNSENGNIHVISEEKLGYLYTGRFEVLPCADRIESYAVRLPSDMGGCEVHVVKCVNPSDCDEVIAFFEKRIAGLRSSEVLSIAPETHEKCFKDAKTYKKGRYAFLLATPDNEAVIRAIEECL